MSDRVVSSSTSQNAEQTRFKHEFRLKIKDGPDVILSFQDFPKSEYDMNKPDSDDHDGAFWTESHVIEFKITEQQTVGVNVFLTGKPKVERFGSDE